MGSEAVVPFNPRRLRARAAEHYVTIAGAARFETRSSPNAGSASSKTPAGLTRDLGDRFAQRLIVERQHAILPREPTRNDLRRDRVCTMMRVLRTAVVGFALLMGGCATSGGSGLPATAIERGLREAPARPEFPS